MTLLKSQNSSVAKLGIETESADSKSNALLTLAALSKTLWYMGISVHVDKSGKGRYPSKICLSHGTKQMAVLQELSGSYIQKRQRISRPLNPNGQ